MVKKAIIYLFYIFTYLTSLRGKNILPNLTNSQEPEPVFLTPCSQSQSRLKKYQEPEPLGKKNQELEPELLEKKVRRRSR